MGTILLFYNGPLFGREFDAHQSKQVVIKVIPLLINDGKSITCILISLNLDGYMFCMKRAGVCNDRLS